MSWETEKGIAYRNEYSRTNYDRFSVMFPKGKKAEYMQLAADQGQSLNAIINQLMEMYQKAQQSNYVQKPVSWALYHTWELCDKKEKPRLRNDCETRRKSE